MRSCGCGSVRLRQRGPRSDRPLLPQTTCASYTLDPLSLDRALAGHMSGGNGPKPPIKAAIVVHLYGQPAAMSDIAMICARRGVLLIEDCAQAHGAGLVDQGVRSWGTAAFGFYPTKNLGALGDAGAVNTNDPTIAQKVKMLPAVVSAKIKARNDATTESASGRPGARPGHCL
jgi:dTDP-4-amino-4,6-dideoxygalactose transaminase